MMRNRSRIMGFLVTALAFASFGTFTITENRKHLGYDTVPIGSRRGNKKYDQALRDKQKKLRRKKNKFSRKTRALNRK